MDFKQAANFRQDLQLENQRDLSGQGYTDDDRKYANKCRIKKISKKQRQSLNLKKFKIQKRNK